MLALHGPDDKVPEEKKIGVIRQKKCELGSSILLAQRNINQQGAAPCNQVCAGRLLFTIYLSIVEPLIRFQSV